MASKNLVFMALFELMFQSCYIYSKYGLQKCVNMALFELRLTLLKLVYTTVLKLNCNTLFTVNIIINI